MSDKIVPSGEYRGLRADGIVLAAHAAVYVPIPKVACTSLKVAFARVLDLDGDVHFEVEWPSIRWDELAQRSHGLFVFAFVRNPWGRLLSCYRSKIHAGRDDYHYRDGVEFNLWKYGDLFRGDMSFDDFVRATASIPDDEADTHFSSQYRNLADRDGLLFVDLVGRFESLADDVRTACRRIGLPPIEPPHLNRTAHGHYADYYSDATRHLVADRWAKDVDLFGYRFEPR